MKPSTTNSLPDPMALLNQRLASLGFATRDSFRVHEVAKILCMCTKQVYALVEEGGIDGVIDIASVGAKQPSLRFPKESIVRFWMRRIR